MSVEMNYVYLQCFKEKSKLRVRIISPGYNNNANCQFPKAIRVEGRKFKVPATAITVVQRGTNKFFYHVKKTMIQQVDDRIQMPSKIFESEECCICLSDPSEMVIVACGHLCMCKECSDEYKTKTCPLCRSNITAIIHKDQLQ